MTLKRYKIMFSVVAIFLVALVSGIAVGKIFVDSIPINIVVSTSEAELRDEDAVVEKLVQKSKSSTPTAFTAVELYEIAEYNYGQKDAYYKINLGYAYNMVGAQTLRSFKLLRDGQFVFDNLSPGQVDVKTRTKHTIGTDLITRNEKGGDYNKNASGWPKCTWDDSNNENYTVDEFVEKYGSNPVYNMPFVISSKTCPTSSTSGVTKNNDGNYEFTITLSGTYLTGAAIHYSWEIYYTSYSMLSSEAKSSKILPSWKNMTMTVVVNDNFDFVSVSYDETYYVKSFAGDQKVNDVYTETFYFDDADIPSLEEVL